MSLTPNKEPVILANLVPGVLAAIVAVATAFDWWDPTEEQIGALAGLAALLVTMATWYARSKVSSPATVAQDAAVSTQRVMDVAHERDAAVAKAEDVKADADGRVRKVAANADREIERVERESLAKVQAFQGGVGDDVVAKLAHPVADRVTQQLMAQLDSQPARPRRATATPPTPSIRVGSRVRVRSGKLEGRFGSVIEAVAGRCLVSEDGADDQDDWVPNDQLEPLGEWVTP